jgi:hypothetical protein
MGNLYWGKKELTDIWSGLVEYYNIEYYAKKFGDRKGDQNEIRGDQ